jgi:murein DD-endopeptidase MepM/ murein hydrolase activator NlpD
MGRILAAALGASILLLPAAGFAQSSRARYCLAGMCQTTCVRDICLHVSTSESFGVIEVENRFNVPIGIRIDFTQLVNVSPYPPAPVRAVVPAGRSRQIVKLTVLSQRAPARFPFNWSFTYGDPMARHHSSARYRLPFGGREKRVLTQGQNGKFTHSGTSAYSYDFGMPIGTPILAARRGRVVEVNDGYTKSGVSPEFLDKANAVTILHADGTFATYAHLDPGAGVRAGMLVNVGEAIGFSGDTGFSTGPHLHFSVWKATLEGGTTLPIRFYSPEARAGFIPTTGGAYMPTCHEQGIPCAVGAMPARPASWGLPPLQKAIDGTCRCRNGSVITTDLPCRMVCP